MVKALFKTLFFIALLALIAEQGMRFYLYGPASFSYEKMKNVTPEQLAGILGRSASPEMVYELLPNLNTFMKTLPFETDEQGIHGPPFHPAKKPAGTFRIVVVGDSVSMGSGVHSDQSFPALLEEGLNGWGSSIRYEVINMSQPGYSLRQYAGIIEKKVLEKSPDLIIIGWCGANDHRPAPEGWYTTPYVPKDQYNAFFEPYLWNYFKITKSKADQPRFTNPPQPIKYSDQETRYIKEMFARIQKSVGPAKIPVVIFQDGLLDIVDPVLINLTRESGFYYLESLDKIPKELIKTDYLISPLDSGPNAAAHEIMAAQLFQFLANQRLVPFKKGE